MENEAKDASDLVKGDEELNPAVVHGPLAESEAGLIVGEEFNPPTDHVEPTRLVDDFIVVPPPNDDTLDGGPADQPLELVNLELENPEIIFEEAIVENNIPLFEEEDEDPSEDEEDDLEEMIFAEDLEDYLNEPDEEMLVTNGSGNSFHSTHQSIFSSSSMANKMDGLDMNPIQGSKTTSSKRKTNEGDEDTASSNLMGSKKPRI